MFEELDLWIGELFATRLNPSVVGPTSVATPCITAGLSCDTCNPATDTCGSTDVNTCASVAPCHTVAL